VNTIWSNVAVRLRSCGRVSRRVSSGENQIASLICFEQPI
jgi:hypothetical protein